jgi:hypothetical protein
MIMTIASKRGLKNFAMSNKGFIFTMDAFLAAALLITGLLLASQYSVKETPTEAVKFATTDLLSALSTLRMKDLEPAALAFYQSMSNFTDANKTIVEQLGTYWSVNDSLLAANLTSYLLSGFFSDQSGFELLLGADSIFQKNATSELDVYSADRMITGVLPGAPLTGSTSSAYLRKITDKTTSAYAYFGGFIGQGNVTVRLDDYPTGIPNSDITRMVLELDVGGNFRFLINDVQCADITAAQLNMSPRVWDVTSCNASISTTNTNNISLQFTSLLNQSFIAGGYFRIAYKSNLLQENLSIGNKRYYFPDIGGIVNLYDSFYVPGTLNSMKIYLSYLSNSKTYLTIGSAIAYQHSATGLTTVLLNSSDLTNFPVNLNYDTLSNNTIPIRFASYNETYSYVYGSNSDVVLITDLSGSMKLRMNSWNNPGNAIPNCKASDIADPTSRRLGVAACLDIQVNAIIMNTSQANNSNRLFLVDFSDNANPFYSPNLSLINKTNIDNEISTRYKSKSQHEIKGGTCLCCAINQAYEILSTYSNANRTKAVIVMTDGVPNYCCGGYYHGPTWECNETATGTTKAWPLPGQPTNCNGEDSDCTGSNCQGPMNAAINAAERIHLGLNATVYSVGFGPIESCQNANFTVSQIAQKGNGSYIVSSLGAVLQSFYNNISFEILARVSQSSQFVSTLGNISPSRLFGTSYIDFEYTPLISAPQPNEISVSVQTPQFGGCSANINIPSGLRVIDSKVVSYSGIHWTDAVSVDGSEVYNLSKYSADYTTVGDPFIVQVPSNLLTAGNRQVLMSTGKNPTNFTGCSSNNSLIYTAVVPSATARSGVVEKTNGCEWTIQFEDDTTSTKKIPKFYSGTKACKYTADNYTLTQGAFDPDDAYDLAVHGILSALDFDNNGKVFVNLDAEDIEIVITTISSVPYLWGPSLLSARSWQ